MIPAFISKTEKQLVLFDMDGVVAEYKYGENPKIQREEKGVYLEKRPILTMIKIAKKLNKRKNLTVGILSSCDFDSQVIEKKQWLKKYMPFIKEENISIIVWNNETYTRETRRYAKGDFIKKIKGYDQIFLIEDTHKNINATNEYLSTIAHHLSEFLD